MAAPVETSPETETPFIVKFFDPQMEQKDFRGRTLEDLLNFTDRQLELSHDYIQILFPLPEGSPFNWQAPVINKATFDAFRTRSELQSTFHRGFCRIARFYGFKVDAELVPELSRGENHREAFGNWVCRMDHNHLRITRVIRSLRVLGLDAHAEAFYNAILQVNEDFPDRIGARSLMYWKRAAERPLHLAPNQDDHDDAERGLEFLLELEKAKAAVAERLKEPDDKREEAANTVRESTTVVRMTGDRDSTGVAHNKDSREV